MVYLAHREKPASDAPSVGLPDIAVLSQVVQESHGRPKCFPSLQKLRLIGVVREEDLTIRYVLVDLALRVGSFGVLIASDKVAEAEEVCNISGRHWDCEARELLVKNEMFWVWRE